MATVFVAVRICSFALKAAQLNDGPQVPKQHQQPTTVLCWFRPIATKGFEG